MKHCRAGSKLGFFCVSLLPRWYYMCCIAAPGREKEGSMHDQERHDRAVRRLAACGYRVFQDDRGDLVQHLRDPTDISRGPVC